VLNKARGLNYSAHHYNKQYAYPHEAHLDAAWVSAHHAAHQRRTVATQFGGSKQEFEEFIKEERSKLAEVESTRVHSRSGSSTEMKAAQEAIEDKRKEWMALNQVRMGRAVMCEAFRRMVCNFFAGSEFTQFRKDVNHMDHEGSLLHPHRAWRGHAART
jgi:hypothetical protein